MKPKTVFGLVLSITLVGLVFQFSLAEAQGTGLVDGTVVSAATSLPIGSATVVLKQGGTTMYTDDANGAGEYLLQLVAPGTYTIVASAPGYAPETTTVVVTAGVTTTQNFALTVAALIVGTVTDATTSLPIGSAIVTATLGSDTYSDNANGAGEYAIQLIPPGTYSVTATAPGYESETATDVVAISGSQTTQDFELMPLSMQVESCDSTGAQKDYFTQGETVYAKGSGYLPGVEFTVYLVDDKSWPDSPNTAIADIIAQTLVTTNAAGNFGPVAVWSSSLPGIYDLVVDQDADGDVDSSDSWDSNDVATTAGLIVTFQNAVPEVPFGTIVASLAMALGIVGFVGLPRLRRKLH